MLVLLCRSAVALITLALLVPLLSGGPGAAIASNLGPRPDVVLFNGVFLTMEPATPQAEAVAIRGRKILAIGSTEKIVRLARRDTPLVNLQGHTVVPGFVDAHSHLFNDAAAAGFSLDEIQQLALSYGITTLGDLYATPEFVKQMRAFKRQGRLRIRTSLYLIYNTNCGEVVGDWYKKYPPTRNRAARLRIGGVKIFADGGSCGKPALSYEPGDLWLTQQEINAAAADAQASGYQVAIHALGDLAVEQAQNAIASALNGQPNAYRHRIEHNAVIPPQLLPRYTQIGIVPTILALYPWCNPKGSPIPPPFRTWEWSWRALLDQNPGLHVAWHGDYPYFDINPLHHLFGFVTRDGIADDGAICEAPDWFKANTLSVEHALPLMNLGAAYALFREDYVGSLKPGKFADLVLLSDNPLTVQPLAIKDIQVWMTMVDGQVEYCAAGRDTYCPNSDSYKQAR